MPKRIRDHHSWLVEELKNPASAANYLNEALKDSPEMFLKALRNVGEANRISVVAKGAGFRRETLYRSLSQHGNPRFKTLGAVLSVLGLGIEIKASKGVERMSAGPPRQRQKRVQDSMVAVQAGHHRRHNP